MDIVIHVAVAENNVIGREGALPWKLSTDLKRFKSLTVGKPVILGRVTFEGLGRALPERLNIVVTRDRDWRTDGVEVAHSLDDALALARIRGRCMPGADEICIIGGGQIYQQAMPLADRLHVTRIRADVEGDTYFPQIDPAIWEEIERDDVPAGPKDSHATSYRVYRRRRSDLRG